MNKFDKKSIKAYDKKADHYDNTFDGKFTGKFKELLIKHIELNENDSVLDIACGNGALLSKINNKKAINGFGIDISGQMIRNASVRYPEFTFVAAPCDKAPFEDSSMDVITVCAAYHHFPNVDSFALEAKRLLKPNGNLYIIEIYLPEVIRVIANPFVPLSKDGDVKFYSYREIEKTFSNVSFRLVKRIKQGHIQIAHLRKK
ncbi:MAG: class I SAM-dependent methyltransferase [Clostridiales bacterium]|jgi:ubiquinone/menaquinone biosynthesis C-methylase UbiE|nr:class I SAM-dependent methyltransferase [Clostridiales bacterium]